MIVSGGLDKYIDELEGYFTDLLKSLVDVNTFSSFDRYL